MTDDEKKPDTVPGRSHLEYADQSDRARAQRRGEAPLRDPLEEAFPVKRTDA